MSESPRTRLMRWRFNLFPAYRGTGAWIVYIERDFREVRIRLPLGRRTRNYVGTIFGGSMYAAVDPIYMIMLMERLGRGYVVWDKAATVRFRRPGRSTLYATFRLDDRELDLIKTALTSERSIDRTYEVDLVDADGEVHASIEQVVQVRRRDGEASAGR